MLPLHGIKVVEFCEVASGPFCGMLLADMGADVIKVERAGVGDSMRQWPPINKGFSENFASLNRNKRSIDIDLKTVEDRNLARRLVLDADVVVENYRPGVMARNGLGYADLRQEKPTLVYCSISAFGQTGPRSGEGGFDLTIQAIGGVMSVTGEAGGAPVKCGVPIADFSAGLYAAFSIASALRRREVTGEGEHIDVSMLGATLGVAALQTSEYFGTGNDPKKLGSAHPRNAPYQAFRAADGYFAMAAGNDRLWRSVCAAIEQPHLAEDGRFLSTAHRTANQIELREILEAVFSGNTTGHWISTFTKLGIPCAPINSYSEILSDDQIKHMNWVQDLELPSGASTKTFISPVMLSGRNLGVRLPPPALGEHKDAIIYALQANAESGKCRSGQD